MDRLRVGIRPEDMTPALNGSMPSEVTVVEPMGNENFLYAEMGDIDLTARIDTEIRPDEGQVVEFGFGEEDLFDLETSEALKTKMGETDIDYEQHVRSMDI